MFLGKVGATKQQPRCASLLHAAIGAIQKLTGLKPHLVRRFKVSNDPKFAEKVTDVVGLYLNPPDRALVLCVALNVKTGEVIGK